MGTADQFEAEVKKLGLGVNVLKPIPGKVYTLKNNVAQAAALFRGPRFFMGVLQHES